MPRCGTAWFNLLVELSVIALMLDVNVLAYTEEENISFINRVIDGLNNKQECVLPSYQEVDELQNAFKELENLYGASYESKLSSDQKLVLQTLLDQWTSFQKRMTSAVVIRSAKKRSFLCKVEEYQLAKHGASICTYLKDFSGPESDRIFERNPLVRYIKHIQTHEVTNYDEVEAKVIYTPFETAPAPERFNEDTIALEGTTTTAATPTTDILDKNEASEKEGENYDPMVDIPAPVENDGKNLYESPSQPAEGLNNVEENIYEEPMQKLELFEQNPEQNVLEPNAEQGLVEKLDAVGEDKLETSTNTSLNDDAFSEVENLPEVESSPEPAFKEDSTTTTSTTTTTTTTTTTPPPPSAPEVVKNIKQDERKRPKVKEFTPDGAELLDFVQDDKDLERLNRVEHIWLVRKPGDEDFIWPDENPSEVCMVNDSIKKKWFDLLNSDPELTKNSKPDDDDEDEESPKNSFRKRRKDFFKQVQDDKRIYEGGVRLGVYDYGPQESRAQPIRKSWVRLADNEFCKMSYNRDYMGDTRPVKAIKSLFSKSDEQNKKKSLIS